MAAWQILALVALAAVAGLLGNRALTCGGHRVDDSGFAIKDLVAPVTTLAVVLMAFVMGQSLDSFGRARENVGAEARVVNEMSESAGRLADRGTAVRVQENLVCYARAVRASEWGPMDADERSPAVTTWTDRIEDELATAKRSDDDEAGRLIELDAGRADARVARIAESSPSNPAGLNGVMLGTVLASIVGFGLFTNAKAGAGMNMVLLGVMALVLSGTLYMVHDLDQPFVGLNRLRPTELVHVQQLVGDDLAREMSTFQPRCTDDGEPRNLHDETSSIASPAAGASLDDGDRRQSAPHGRASAAP